MKRVFLWTICLGLALAVGLHALHAESTQEILDRLPGIIHADATAAKSVKGSNADLVAREEQRRLNLLAQIRGLLASGSENGAETFLQGLTGSDASEALRTTAQAVMVQYRKEKLEREDALNDEGEAAVRTACELAFKATGAKDLDDSRLTLMRWLDKRNDLPTMDNSRPRSERTRRSAQGALSFINRWQDYLAARAGGADELTLNESLRTLANSSETAYLPVQRSAILALLKPVRPVERSTPAPTPAKRSAPEVTTALNAVLDRTKTLADLPTAIRDLQAIRDEQLNGYINSTNNDLNEAVTALQIYHKAALEFQAGLRTNLELASSHYDLNARVSSGIEGRLVPLRAQLVALELPRLLNASADEKPAPGESLDRFWRRLLDAAKQRGDWATVAQGLEVARLLVFTAEPRPGELSRGDLDNSGFKSLLMAFNFEAAGQPAQAVAAYLNALSSPVPDLPAKLIGEKLAALKQAYPKEYEAVAGAGYRREYSASSRPQYYRVPSASEEAASPEPDAVPPPAKPVLAPPVPAASVSPAPSPTETPAANTPKP